MLQAIWVDCPGVRNDGVQGHAMRDFCWNCAPYWERLPICPNCRRKVGDGTRGARRKCKGCRQFVYVGFDQGDVGKGDEVVCEPKGVKR